MKHKKFLAVFTGTMFALQGMSSPILAMKIRGNSTSAIKEEFDWLNAYENKLFISIENMRHEEDNIETAKALIIDHLKQYRHTKEFKMYLLSMVVKLMDKSELDEILSKYEKFVGDCENSFYFHLVFRCLSEKYGNRKIVNNKFINMVEKKALEFLKSDKFSNDMFKGYNQHKKLKCLQSVFIISKFKLMDANVVNKILSSIDIESLKTIENKSVREESFVHYAKIPENNQQAKRIEALEAVIGEISEKKFKEAAEKEQGREALIQYARIPGDHQKTKGIEALEALSKSHPTEEICSEIFKLSLRIWGVLNEKLKNSSGQTEKDIQALQERCDNLKKKYNRYSDYVKKKGEKTIGETGRSGGYGSRKTMRKVW